MFNMLRAVIRCLSGWEEREGLNLLTDIIENTNG